MITINSFMSAVTQLRSNSLTPLCCKLPSIWVCMTFVLLYCSQSMAFGTEYQLIPAQPVAGQEVIIQAYGEGAASFSVIAPATLEGSTIQASTAVVAQISTFIGYGGVVGRFTALEVGEYQVVIDEVQLSPSGEEWERSTFSTSFEVAPDSFYISSGMTGSWYNPEESGHGINLEFLTDKRVIGYWYTFDSNGDPKWLLLNGTSTATDAEITILEVTGGVFPPEFDADNIIESEWGTMRLSFLDCTHGTMSWETDQLLYSSGEMQILKISPASDLPCRDLSNTATDWTDVPFVKYARNSENVLVHGYSTIPGDTVPDWSIQHEELEGYPDTVLHITASQAGRLTLLADSPRISPYDSDRFVMAELTVRIATRQTRGCFNGGDRDPSDNLRFTLYTNEPQIGVTKVYCKQDEDCDQFGLITSGNFVSETVNLGSPLLVNQEEDCEGIQLQEKTLISTSAQLIARKSHSIGLHIDRNLNGEPILDFYLIDANIRYWEIARPEFRSMIIPVTE